MRGQQQQGGVLESSTSSNGLRATRFPDGEAGDEDDDEDDDQDDDDDNDDSLLSSSDNCSEDEADKRRRTRRAHGKHRLTLIGVQVSK